MVTAAVSAQDGGASDGRIAAVTAPRARASALGACAREAGGDCCLSFGRRARPRARSAVEGAIVAPLLQRYGRRRTESRVQHKGRTLARTRTCSRWQPRSVDTQ
eukprot:2853193-Pleurochrysis_carterae.AAC.1